MNASSTIFVTAPRFLVLMYKPPPALLELLSADNSIVATGAISSSLFGVQPL